MLFEPEVGVSLLDFHLERLEDSADYFDFAIDLNIIRKHLISLQFSSPSKLRLMLSPDGHYELEAHHLTYSKVEIDLRLAGSAVNSSNVFLFHKTTNRDVYQKALNSVQNCDDVILWNERDEVTETTIANLFLEFDGELITPPLESGLLAGTYRRDMLEKKLVREAVVRKSDLKRAKKIYIANSIRGLVSARLLD
jgi:para-aminobenzoate synthetase/4-amino-4-deoxychorismate lyase